MGCKSCGKVNNNASVNDSPKCTTGGVSGCGYCFPDTTPGGKYTNVSSCGCNGCQQNTQYSDQAGKKLTVLWSFDKNKRLCQCSDEGGNNNCAYSQCCCSSASSNIATETTFQVTQPAWDVAVGGPTDQASPENDALRQLAYFTAGMLAQDATTEKEVKDAVTLSCTWIISNVQELADWWKSRRNLHIMTSTNLAVFQNTRVTQAQDSQNLKQRFQEASTFLSQEHYFAPYQPSQWVYCKGTHSIQTNSTTQNLMGATSVVQSTLDVSIFQNTDIDRGFTIGYSNVISLEIGLMTGIASQTTTPTEEVALGAENAYPKGRKDKLSTAISAARADTGIITGIFLDE